MPVMDESRCREAAFHVNVLPSVKGLNEAAFPLHQAHPR